jgi:hypothetical protein
MFTGHMERVRPVFMLRKLDLSTLILHRPGLAAPEFSSAGGEQIKNCTRFCTDFLHAAQTGTYWLFWDDSG